MLLPSPRTMWVNMHPVGIFMVTPPTLYSKVRTGVVPIAVACAPVGAARTRAPVAARVVVRRVKYCRRKAVPPDDLLMSTWDNRIL
jgi:hypothetical protein